MYFIISLIIIIVLHELGHFIAARLCDCGVEELALGFGKNIYSKKGGDTTYKINLILLGGYCKLQDELKFTDNPTAFTNKTYFQKVIITLAGVFVNVVTGLPAFLIGYHFNILWLWIFGYYSLIIGATNLIPIPALDGSIPIWLLFEKKLGKEKLYPLMEKVFGISFKILITINILCIPYLIYLWMKGLIV